MSDIKSDGNWRFIAEFIRRPRSTGAIAPSGQALTARMTAGLGPETGQVLELGGGTGTITAAILGRGVTPSHLTVLETNPAFADRLRLRFPHIQVLEHSAFEIAMLPAPTESFDAVISGLPLVNMKPHEHEAILTGAFSRLAPKGFFRQFTYRPKVPVAQALLAAHGLVARYEGMAVRNLPPAFVYRIERKKED